MKRCQGKTISGTQCKKQATGGSEFCAKHDPSRKGGAAPAASRVRSRTTTTREGAALADLAVAIRKVVSMAVRAEMRELFRGLRKL